MPKRAKRNPSAPKHKKVVTFKDVKRGLRIVVHRGSQGEHTERLRITGKPYQRDQFIAEPGKPKRTEKIWWVEYHSVTWNFPARTTLLELGICPDEQGEWAPQTYALFDTEK